MSTRSLICKENEDHTYTGIYCHHDGDPDYNGRMLVEYYDTPEKVDELLALGDISSLGEHVSPPTGHKHSFDAPLPDVCVAYHRDRGEAYNPPRIITPQYYTNSWCEYMYVFCRDHKWRYFITFNSANDKPQMFTEKWAFGYYGNESSAGSTESASFDQILNGVTEDE